MILRTPIRRATRFALLLLLFSAAVPSIAFAQSSVTELAGVQIACPPDECYAVPYFAGEGGFVGALAAGLDQATVIAVCGNVTTTLGLAPRPGEDTVALLFNDANGLSCPREDAEFEIHGLAEGGWYWTHHEANTAVGRLLRKDYLLSGRGSIFPPIDPGGVELTDRNLVTFLRDPRSGRVGLLSHYAPRPPLPLCGRGLSNNCHIRGSYSIDLEYADAPLLDGATLLRAFGQTITVTASVSGSGYVSTAVTPDFRVQFYAATGPDGGGIPSSVDVVSNGTYDIGSTFATDTYCCPSCAIRKTPLDIYIRAQTLPFWNVIPKPTYLTSRMFTVHCSATEGATPALELVPDNRFPVRE